jgi:hypothetical protein
MNQLYSPCLLLASLVSLDFDGGQAGALTFATAPRLLHKQLRDLFALVQGVPPLLLTTVRGLLVLKDSMGFVQGGVHQNKGA